MKKFTMIVVLMLALVLALGAFAACNDKEDENQNLVASEQVTVIFDMDGEGENVTLSGKAGEALQVPAVADKSTFYFGGWHEKMDCSDEAVAPTVFPEKDKTYYAEWDLGYTFKAMLEQKDGTFAADDSYSVKGRVMKGSTNSVTLDVTQLNKVEGYGAEKASYTLQISPGQRDFECEVKYLLLPLEITYVTGLENDVVKSGKYGMSVIGEDELGEYSHRNFIGWATEEGGEAVYFPGDEIKEEGNISLYAVWELGLEDVFGGNDCIYVSSKEENAVYLERYRSDELLKGTLDGSLFSVKVNDTFTLDGVLLEDGFYYFKDTVEKTYENIADENESLEFVAGGKGKAILHKAGGADVEGKYQFDAKTSSYTFVPTSGDNFIFRLIADGEKLCFEKADNVIGSYILRLGTAANSQYLIFDFDGFGGGLAHYMGATAPSSYEWDETGKLYKVYLGEEDADEFDVRILDDEAGDTVDGILLKGSFLLRDDLAGSYGPAIKDKVQKDTGAKDDLTLDGFGKGTYKDKAIDYTYESYGWYEENPYDDEAYGLGTINWVTFTYEGEKITLCIEISQSNNANFYIPAKGEFAQEFFLDTSGLGSVYKGNAFENYENTLGVFVYKYGKSDGAIVTVYSMYVGALTGTQVLTEIDWGVVESVDNVTYRYRSTYEYFGKTNDVEFQFRYQDGSIVPQFYKAPLKVSDNLTLDIFGAVHYNGDEGNKDINYAYDPGFVASFITFSKVPNGNGGTHTEVYRVNFDENDEIESFTLIPDFHMITDTANGCAIATIPIEGQDGVYETYIGIPQGRGYYFTIKGTAKLLSGDAGKVGARYQFDIDPAEEEETTKFLQSQGEDIVEIMSPYYSFIYRISSEAKGECDLLDKAFSLKNKAGDELVLSDNGEMSLTMKGTTEKANSYHYLVKDDDRQVIEMYVVKGDTRYNRYITLTVDENGAVTDFSVGGDEANIYYNEAELGSGLEAYGRYFILLGGGECIMVSSGMSIYAVYEKTDEKFTWNGTDYTEYEIGVCYDAQDDIPDIFYYIAVATEDFSLEGGLKWHGGKYLQKIYASGDFKIVGGGTLKGDGYHRGEYIDSDGNSYEAAMYYVNVYDRYFDSDAYPEASENGEETNNVYIAYYDENGEMIDWLIFDVTSAGLDERDVFNGVYAEVIDNAPSSREIYLYLNGQGVATIYNSDDQPVETGKYSLVPKLGEKFLSYVPDDAENSLTGTFVFWIYRMDGTNCYIIYDEKEKGVYTGASGELLITDGFAQGVYMDKYGVVKQGLCTYLTSTQVEFTPYGETEHTYFELNNEKYSFVSGNFEWLIDGNMLVRYLGTDRDLDLSELPSNITEIAAKAFQSSNIKSINLGNVTKIGDQAFEYCESLESVTAPKVTSVGRYAFAGCYLLDEIDLSNAETIEDGAFVDAPLTNVKLKSIKKIGQYAFSHENSVMTIFDLTECASLSELTVPDYAFISRVDGAIGVTAINMKAYVKDVDVLNTLISNQNASEVLKNTAGLNLADDPMKGAVYIGFTNRSVYEFDGGTLVMRQGNSSRIFGVYVMSESGTGIDIYARGGEGNGIYQKSLESVKGDNTLTIANEILFKNNAQHTVKTQDNKNTVVFTFSTTVNAAFGSIAVTATLNGEKAVNATLSAENGTMRLAIGEKDTKYYDVKITGASTCEINELGDMLELYTSDKDKLYRFTGFVKDGKITELIGFGFHSGDSVDPQDQDKFTPVYSSYTVQDIDFADDGSVTFGWNYSDAVYTIKVTYIAGGTNGGSIDVDILSVTMSDNASGSFGKAQITVTFDIAEYRVKTISYFAYNAKTGFFADPIEEEIVSVTEKEYHATQSDINENEPAGITVLEVITENGTYTVTVTARRNPVWGKMRTYSFSFTVEKIA